MPAQGSIPGATDAISNVADQSQDNVVEDELNCRTHPQLGTHKTQQPSQYKINDSLTDVGEVPDTHLWEEGISVAKDKQASHCNVGDGLDQKPHEVKEQVVAGQDIEDLLGKGPEEIFSILNANELKPLPRWKPKLRLARESINLSNAALDTYQTDHGYDKARIEVPSTPDAIPESVKGQGIENNAGSYDEISHVSDSDPIEPWRLCSSEL